MTIKEETAGKMLNIKKSGGCNTEMWTSYSSKKQKVIFSLKSGSIGVCICI